MHGTIEPPIARQHDLLILIPHLGAGGAQRVASVLANSWAVMGYRVYLATVCRGTEERHDVDPAITRMTLHGFAKQARSTRRRLPREVPQSWPPLGWLSSQFWRRIARPLHKRLNWRYTSKSGRYVHGLTLLMRAMKQASVSGRLDSRAVRACLRLAVERSKCRRIADVNHLMTAAGAPVVLAFLGQTSIVATIARQGLSCRLIICERNDPARQRLGSLWEPLRPLFYGLADHVTANSCGALATMQSYVDPGRLDLVANPLYLPPHSVSHGRRDGHVIIAVARLTRQKGIDVLLEAVALADAKGLDPGWRVEILGSGPEQQALEARAGELGIASRVRFRGHITDPYPALLAADVFVLPSRHEGMPNALLEAMACGLAPIVSDASPGPLEHVEQDITGVVTPVGDAQALARALLELAADADRRKRLGGAARDQVRHLAADNVVATWTQLLALPERSEPTVIDASAA